MPQRVQESVEVRAPLREVFDYWSNFKHFPEIMSNVEEVRVIDQERSHWKVKGPVGTSVEFDARTTEMNPDRGIGWNSVEGEVDTSGEVRFKEVSSDRTRIEVTMNYADPPGGKVGEVVADAISNPERMMREDLDNFAARVERGEVEFAGRPGIGQMSSVCPASAA